MSGLPHLTGRFSQTLVLNIILENKNVYWGLSRSRFVFHSSVCYRLSVVKECGLLHRPLGMGQYADTAWHNTSYMTQYHTLTGIEATIWVM